MKYDVIQELAYQAEDNADYDVDAGEEFHIAYTRRLSEAIVRQCISVLQKRYMGDQNREDMEVRRCIEDVKKHFGIE